MGKRLEGKVAIVTGAGRGIGRAEALALAKEGARVVVNDLGGGPAGGGASANPADDVVAEIKKLGGIAVANYDSVSAVDGAEHIIKTALDKFNKLDILVNNAGILRDRMIFNMTDEEWDIIIKIHLYGQFYCSRAACRIMRQQKYGRIINTSSEAGLGHVGQTNYSAAKEGIVGLTRSIARDLGPYGVTCNAIRPRAATRLTINPEIHAAWERMGRHDLVEQSTKLLPEDVASFVAYLATDEAANINGCVFVVGSDGIGLYPEPVPVKMIYQPNGFSIDELCEFVPRTLAQGLVNPAPPKEQASEQKAAPRH